MEQNKAPRQDYLPGCCLFAENERGSFLQKMSTKGMNG